MSSANADYALGTRQGGVLWGPANGLPAHTSLDPAAPSRADDLAFAGLALFMLLLFARPGELFPNALGPLPLAKVIGAATILLYVSSRLRRGITLTIWPAELRCLVAIAGIALVLAPLALDRAAAFGTLFGTYVKIVAFVAVLINLVDSPRRLTRLLLLVVLCASVLAVFALRSFLSGDFALGGTRIQGVVGGGLNDPNDLAMNFDVLIPIAVAMALAARGIRRLSLLACAAILTAAMFATLSRGGFLGFAAMAALMTWKLGKGRALRTILIVALAGGIVVLAAPGGYGARLRTIGAADDGDGGSIQQRLSLLRQGLRVASQHLVVGVGMGNFILYTAEDRVAHNSFVEIAAELGAGLAAYLTLFIVPWRRLYRIERATADRRGGDPSNERAFLMCVGLQGSLVAYLVCSMFLSIQYTCGDVVLACSVAFAGLHLPLRATAASAPSRGALWRAPSRGAITAAPAGAHR